MGFEQSLTTAKINSNEMRSAFLIANCFKSHESGALTENPPILSMVLPKQNMMWSSAVEYYYHRSEQVLTWDHFADTAHFENLEIIK